MSSDKNDKGRKGPDPKEPRRALGRGLDALLPVTQVATATVARAESPYRAVGIEEVQPRADQPRKHFDEAALTELAATRRDRSAYISLARDRIAALETLLQSDRGEFSDGQDRGWDPEGVREESRSGGLRHS